MKASTQEHASNDYASDGAGTGEALHDDLSPQATGNLTMTRFFEDLRGYREGLLAQGFWALQVYRFGHARHNIRSSLIRKPWGMLHLLLSKWIEITCGITIGDTARIGRRLVIEHFGGIVIHGHAVIGDDCVIRHGVTIGNKTPDKPLDAPTLGARVNIGAGAKLIGKITIGDDCFIGANAVVLMNVPSGSIAVGVPAVVKPYQSK